MKYKIWNPFQLIIVLIFTNAFFACKDDPPVTDTTRQLVIKTDEIINTSFIGNGVQWGGYELMENWTGDDDFSESDWQKLTQRIDFMQPSFMRIMIDANWNYINNNKYDNTKTPDAQLRILQYCTDNNIDVMFGEWGHKYTNDDVTEIDETWIGWAADYLNWLVNIKGFSCIKYYDMINEPNGSWSSARGNYYLWREVMVNFYNELVNKGLATKVKMVGPGVVAWDAGLTDWIDNTAEDLGEIIELYDIHTYPGQSWVHGGDYRIMLDAYKNAVPGNKQIVMSEIGFKYSQDDLELKQENEARIEDDPFASDDSNMLIYEAFYAIDIANALVSCMMAGFGGSLIWDMDDAMYNNPDYTSGESYNVKKLKRWGFWNILGEEVCMNAGDEEIRPFFYPVSLLCRYFPKGSEIYNVDFPDKKGLLAIAGQKDGYYTIVLVNSHYASYENLLLTAPSLPVLRNVKEYNFHSELDGSYTGLIDNNGLPVPEDEDITMDLGNGYNFNLQGQSVMVYTNFPF